MPSKIVRDKNIMISKSAADTQKLGAKLASQIKKLPTLILLSGDLGAGKTEWARGFIHKYIDPKIVVNSPSYSIVNAYKKGIKQVFHFDLYRLKDIDDLESVGFWDFLEKKNVILVEWGSELPHQWADHINVINIEFKILSQGERELRLKKA